MLALERAVASSLPRAPVQALAVALMMPALVLPLAVASTRALVLAFVPRALVLLPGPYELVLCLHC